MPTFFISKVFQILATFFVLVLIATEAEARPCLAFDANFNLYAFGFGGKDFQLGTQDTWTSGVFSLSLFLGIFKFNKYPSCHWNRHHKNWPTVGVVLSPRQC
jgi:hypothetical protein